MGKIEKIRQKIKELRELLEDHNYYLDNSEQALGYSAALDDIWQFLDTLSEEPDKSLEEAAEKYIKKGRYLPEAFVVRPAFIAGAEWKERQMLKDAEECELYWDGDFLAIDLNMRALGYSERDKVKVVVLKAEEE